MASTTHEPTNISVKLTLSNDSERAKTDRLPVVDRSSPEH